MIIKSTATVPRRWLQDCLRAGRHEWNLWRQSYPQLSVDLSEVNLSGLDLRGYDLQGCNFSHSVLRGVNLRQASLCFFF